MTSRISEEESIFDQAIQIADPGVRNAFLDQACGGNADLRASVDELLAFHDTGERFLETPAVPLSTPEKLEQPGTVLGRYRIVEAIGQGGFGVVYRAQQEEPVRRDVALKIIKLGMDTADIIRRFETERQMLALMNHPFIASELDAGATDSGRPYFVMELVDGQPIDEFCDHHQLDVRARLKLFQGVCQAIQHAHQKGIVHRDLKPSNILVHMSHGRPEPKVIDFGIAKALRGSVMGTLTQTGQHQLVGTPEFMSPEQVTAGSDIDTRADIHTLGGVLFKLLAGVSPLDCNALRHVDLAEAYRIIREAEPRRPSTRFGGIDEQRQAEIASRRCCQPAMLRRQLRNDLDWIVVKAMQNDRARRYQTVNDLDADIDRFLQHQPVLAGPPSVWYQARKFVRRNRFVTAASLLAVLSLSIGMLLGVIGLLQARQGEQRANQEKQNAEQQRDVAENEREKSQRTLLVLQQLIGAAHSEYGHPPDYTLRQLLTDFSASLGDQLAGQPEIEASVRRILGKSYLSLGELTQAVPHLERALELRRDHLGEDHPQTAQSRIDHAKYLLFTSRVIAAQREAERALHILQPLVKLPDDEPPPAAVDTSVGTLVTTVAPHAANRLEWMETCEDVVAALHVLVEVYHEYGDHDIALSYSEDAWRIARRAFGERHPQTLIAKLRVAQCRLTCGQESTADQMSREALEAFHQVRPEEHVDIAFAKRVRSMVLRYLGKLPEAERLIRESLAINEKLLGRENGKVVHDLIVLSDILRRSRQFDEAEKLAREAVELAERVMVEHNSLRIRAYVNLASILQRRHRQESVDVWAKAIEIKREILGDHAEVSRLLHKRGCLLRCLRKPAEAAECFQEASHIAGLASDKELVRETPRLPDDELSQFIYFVVTLDLINTLVDLGRLEDAAAATSLIQQRAERIGSRPAMCVVQLAQAELELARGDPSKAEQTVRDAISGLKRKSAWPVRIRAACLRGECLIQLKRYRDAENILTSTRQMARQLRTPTPFLRFLIDEQLAELKTASSPPEKP